MTAAQKKAAKARFKRDGGIGKKKKGTTTTRKGGSRKTTTTTSPGKFKKNTSFVTILIGGAIGVEAASILGFEQARALESAALELASKIGIASGAGLLAAAIALKMANTKKASRIPIVGGAAAMVGQTWANTLSDFNLRP